MWWYYIAIFLGASLPWTGAVIYGMIDGFKQRHTAFIYNMTWGVGVVLFYTLMATKYPLYTFVSLVPFSAIGAMGVMKIIRKGKSRAVKWVIMGPTLLLWIAYVAGSFFAPWGFYFLLYVVAAVAVLLYSTHGIRKKGIVLLVSLS